MSANARVFDTSPASVLSLVERPAPQADGAFTVADDLADSVEIIHHIANLAG